MNIPEEFYAVPAVCYKITDDPVRMNDRDIKEIRKELHAKLTDREEKHKKATRKGRPQQGRDAAEYELVKVIIEFIYLDRFGLLHDDRDNRIYLTAKQFHENHDIRLWEKNGSSYHRICVGKEEFWASL